MIAKTSILRVMLVLPFLVPASLGQTQGKQVAWLRDVENDESTPLSQLKALEGNPFAGNGVFHRDESEENIEASGDPPIFLIAEKRDPKRVKNNKNNTQNDNDSDSGVGKFDISMPLSIGAGIAAMAIFLHY
ncbi:hypothetical protein F5Y13DRAFT_116148 [Hypoxylon sp. FL1857]|nr:hypothetical protein F5Y13DRAFT_116148 [Hypoxylon sp. FL1857]